MGQVKKSTSGNHVTNHYSTAELST